MREVPYFKPYINEEEKSQILEALESGWISTGPKTIEFENSFRGYLEIPTHKSVSAVNSATAGLHLALAALEADEETCVFLPTMTFTATAEIAAYSNSKIHLIDSLPNDPNIDMQSLRERIENCKAKRIIVIIVHFGGSPVDIPSFLKDLDSRVHVIEDAAHALPASINGINVGNFDTSATVFSFYANKTMTTGEGGMVVSGNEVLARKLQILRSHGIDRSAFDRFQGKRERAWEYDVVAAGFKYNMSDLLASIGIAQIQKIDFMNSKRKEIADAYSKAFINLPIVQRETPRQGFSSANHIYSIELNSSAGLNRDEFISVLYSQGISTSVHYKPLHMMSFWSKKLGTHYGDFPSAEARYQNTISLPLYPGMTDSDLDYVISKVVQALN